MKLGAIYTVFNGLELLEGSISQIISELDHVVIVYQTLSNRGNSDPGVERFVMSLMEKMKDRKIMAIPFYPDMKTGTKENERAKHNLGLDILKKLGCTHFMLSACDHYYFNEDFKRAKIKAEAFDVTLTGMFTYYKKPEWQLTPREDYYMPFICRLYSNTRYVNTQWPAYKVDPAVRVAPASLFFLFPENEILMHHYSMIRENIDSKFDNAAASSRWGEKGKVYREEFKHFSIETNEPVAYFGGRRVIEVPNYFGL